MITVTAFNPAPHSGGDNAGYVTLAYSLLHDHAYRDVYDPQQLLHTKYPPVFPALLAGWILAGARSWTALKLVPALSTVLAVLFAFLWVERRRGPWMAAAVALTLALSSSVVYYSHWILSDPTFLAFTLAALWAMERAQGDGSETRGARALRGAPDRGNVPDADRGVTDRGAVPEADAVGQRWLWLGGALAGLAYFTRSAGLPLLVAIAAWLAWRGRWRAFWVFSLCVGAPALLWWLRARGVGDVQYVSEFWMADPYRPELGRVGLGGLLSRMAANAKGYTLAHLPGGIVGNGGGAAAGLGIALVIAAAVGWVRRLRRRVAPAELFVPLYAGLILLWPEVWSGDRFALPLYPLLFLYAAETVHHAAARVKPALATPALATALILVVLPALASWRGAATEASACARVVRVRGPFACYGPGFEGFADAAAWAGGHLPAGSSVWARKPRIFFVLSGLTSRTYPFDTDPEAILGQSDALGVRYAVLDRIDGLGARYLAGAVRAQPGAFCSVTGFGRPGGVRTELLGILPEGERSPPAAEAASGGVRIRVCPPEYQAGAGGVRAAYSSASSLIPLLTALDP